MNILINPNIRFDYAGYFISSGSWKHPERTEMTYELICVTKGTVYMFDDTIGDICAEAGTVILLEPGCRHYGTACSENVRFYWLHFSAEGNLPFDKRCFNDFEQVQLFKELLHLNNLPQAPYYAVNAVLIHILSELYKSSDCSLKYDRRAEEIYEWLRINADAKLTAGVAAEHFGFSADHLSRILKANYGCGIKELTARFITEKARSLLCNTGLYVKEIADQLGFSSDKAFIGFFKYHEGIFPEQFRNRFFKTHMNNK